MSKSDVYLVSSKPTDSSKDEKTFDNLGFTDEKISYNADNGVDVPTGEAKSFPLRPYRGMGKEDLLHFSSQPFWRRLRLICISIIVLGWLALILTVVVLVLVYPKCKDPSPRSWWQSEAVYRVYVPSFKDSNDDGVGDLKGIESKLDYIKGLGFGVISLSPFYQTVDTEATPPGADFGADFGAGNDMAITDHMAVGGVYGTMADFDDLISEANERGMYVIVDFIPNLTSDQHPWFDVSKANSTNEKRNYYVWQVGVTGPPNNWQSVYGGPAWSNLSGAVRDEYYLHQFQQDTPDLNLRSEQVQEELENILTFWMDHGVSGFNIRDASYLYEDYDLRDEPAISAESGYAGLDHIYTTNQPEVYSTLARWRSFVRSYNKTTVEKLIMVETNNLDVRTLYGECVNTGAQIPLNTMLAQENGTCDGVCVAEYIDGWFEKMSSSGWPNWVAGDDNTQRLADRFDPGFINAFTITAMLLPGTPVYYYGDEIGMRGIMDSDTNETWSRARSMRSIMTWENSTNAGFCNSTCSTWTEIGDPADGNVEVGTPLSHLIRQLVSLRKEQTFLVGDYITTVRDSAVISFVREFDGQTGYLVAVNFGPNEETRDFTGSHSTIQKEAIVSFIHGGGYDVDDEADTSSLKVPAYGAVVVSWDYMAKDP